ncbi:hypothetical protein JMJ35_001266 [Cladonia borealis]|uniref:DyP dimeric alpha+beta barrel domain-containing protein n=1 Tax=Cladonia borealis TaxID=184061 RepID=A0AA39R886_9LECA|nr:hypothetical protein JMJ35_001266 [Cladonia borealis]
MSSSSLPPLDLKNVQGDILTGGLPKKTETFYFFQIEPAYVRDFRTQLTQLLPLITTTAEVLNEQIPKITQSKKDAAEQGKAPRILEMSGVNIAFTHKGLILMGITDEIGDSAFDAGMLAGAAALGDKGTTSASGEFIPNWVPAFKHDIHGVILITGDRHETVDRKLAQIENIFCVGAHNALIHEVYRTVGDVRPGKEKGHEHFGFMDGISNPAVQDVTTNPFPGQETIPQGIVLLGREGDAPTIGTPPKPVTRPPWALDGSFLTFRYLFQLVPEFNSFLEHNPIPEVPDRELGSELLGARLVGRWKSGAPIDITPTQDDPDLGGTQIETTTSALLFPATRLIKTDALSRRTSNATTSRRIVRAGIAFGPEVTDVEKNGTLYGRGLLFAAYQSNLVNGFQFLQQSWANNTSFPPKKGTPGFDPIIGQAPDGGPRTMSGTNPNNQTTELYLPQEWVVPKGGEYFFSPSIPALKETFALAASKSEL